MALTNIFNEPRREITETAVGIAVTSIPVALDYEVASWLMKTYPDDFIWFGALAAGAGIIIAGWVGLLIIHEIGDVACCLFEGIGVQMRPKRRAIWER